jgi:hypothetical protein
LLRREIEPSEFVRAFGVDWTPMGSPRTPRGAMRPKVEHFYLSEDDRIIAVPASTRAALVMSAVGCEWRVMQ